MSSSHTIDSVPSRQVFKLMLLGAAAFWLPDALLHALPTNGMLHWHDVRILTIVLPLTFAGTFLATKRMQRQITPKRIGLLMLAGVWLFGGLCIMIGASFSGGGLLMRDGIYWAEFLILLSLLPPYTFVMAIYDESHFALALVTVTAFLIWLVQVSAIPFPRHKSAAQNVTRKAA